MQPQPLQAWASMGAWCNMGSWQLRSDQLSGPQQSPQATFLGPVLEVAALCVRAPCANHAGCLPNGARCEEVGERPAAVKSVA